MSAHEPPAMMTRYFCDDCGQFWLHTGARPDCNHLRPNGAVCTGRSRTLTYELRAEPQRTREEMVAAGSMVLNRAATVFRPVGRDIAEAVLIAAGVIDSEPNKGAPGCTCDTPPFAPPEPAGDCPHHSRSTL